MNFVQFFEVELYLILNFRIFRLLDSEFFINPKFRLSHNLIYQSGFIVNINLYQKKSNFNLPFQIFFYPS